MQAASLRRDQQRIVGIGEMLASGRPDDVLVTYSLGSCIGFTLYDPVIRMGGMLHSMLPLSSADPDRAAANAALYTDTGISAMLRIFFEHGSRRRDLVACAVGGANQTDRDDLFRVGSRNQAVLRKLLWRNEILLRGEDLGGAVSRTLYLDMSSGLTLLRASGTTRVLNADGKG